MAGGGRFFVCRSGIIQDGIQGGIGIFILIFIGYHYVGTREQPGLVLGLDRGGACRGVAFRVAQGAEEETVAYLREREQVTDVYLEAHRTVRLLNGTGRVVKALTYLADPNHAQYAGRLPLEEQLRIVRDCKGEAGANIDYVLNTVRHLEEEGVHDAVLGSIAARLTASKLS